MDEPIREALDQEMKCERLLSHFHGLTGLDRRCYRELTEADEPLTVDELTGRVNKERSTVYRSLRRLWEAGLVEREQINYESGGYYHVFYPSDVGEVAEEMQRMLNNWYATMGLLIDRFRNEYGSSTGSSG